MRIPPFMKKLDCYLNLIYLLEAEIILGIELRDNVGQDYVKFKKH